jgi:hypothetical protein
MRIYLTAGILLGLLAGCSSDQAQVADTAQAAAGKISDSAFAFRSPALSFASLPDRGELLAYEKGRQVKHKGAYTAYPVAISEAHALHAMRSGELVVNAPNGEPIRLAYERHEENQDGNWTWIGRNAEGAEAILTFGEKAVFGVIPQGATETLRLTMSGGQSWLVQTDRSKLAGLDGALRREGGDQLIPPKLSSAGSAQLASMRAEPATAGASAASAVVDVLLGYTNGFASQLGGQSQANTRLVNMIAITNQAYANSGVSMRVRLVKTLQVNYADNTDNGDALEKLTGYKSGTGGGPITPDPAFDALRAAREESGADLVSLVRAFRTPENNGCGIAWLIGGDESGIIQSDAPFGYSVVSDGTDLDEGDSNTYFCREETLAHEMGHNMGQAHNEEDSESTGVHAYSYGYRESSSTGFYTVMAYPQEDSDQFSIRYFANPTVKYSGRATGVANQSDNVRSLNITMPIISEFRATVVPVSQPARNDFNGDRKSDVLWRHATTGQNVIWRSANRTNGRQALPDVSIAFKVAGVGDFNGDGKADILWRHSSTGENIIWRSADRKNGRQALPSVGIAFKVAGIGDFNGDGQADILWRNSVTGENVIWKSADRASGRQSLPKVSLNYQVAGIGDFDGDGRSDILWRVASTGENVIWRSANRETGRQALPSVNTQFRVAGIGDIDGDGRSDIIWRNFSTGGNVVWKGADKDKGRKALPTVSLSFQLAEVADFDGDGESDLIWRHSNGQNVLWRSADRTNGRVSLPTVDSAFQIASP